jgi:large subunit ribosomal protein L24
MKTKFSTSWKSSKQPRKQRKYRYNAPLHIKGKFISSHLSPELRKKYQFRAFRLRTGDKVKILKGIYKGKEEKVIEVNLKKGKVYIDKIQITRIDGNIAKIPFDPSNLMITELVLLDKKRKAKIESKIKDTKEKSKSKKE